MQILRSATEFGTNVKAVAVTGSLNAITTGDDIENRTFNSSEWLPVRSMEFVTKFSTEC